MYNLPCSLHISGETDELSGVGSRRSSRARFSVAHHSGIVFDSASGNLCLEERLSGLLLFAKREAHLSSSRRVDQNDAVRSGCQSRLMKSTVNIQSPSTLLDQREQRKVRSCPRTHRQREGSH